jgi:hypothetical protein
MPLYRRVPECGHWPTTQMLRSNESYLDAFLDPHSDVVRGDKKILDTAGEAFRGGLRLRDRSGWREEASRVAPRSGYTTE